MRTVTSKDGTLIAFDQYGEGPALILVAGALGVRSPHPMSRQLTELLSEHFTVIDYDRRGRGDSGDTLPYAVQREVEDIEALRLSGIWWGRRQGRSRIWLKRECCDARVPTYQAAQPAQS